MKSLKLDLNKHSVKCINHLRLISQLNMPESDLLIDDFRLASARLARKQLNLKLATRLITDQIQSIYSKADINTNPSQNIFESLKGLVDQQTRLNLHNNMRLLIMESELEAAKLLNQMNANKADSVELIANSVLRHADAHLRNKLLATSMNAAASSIQLNSLFTNPIVQNQSNFNSNLSNDLLNEKCAKCILALVDWLGSDSTLLKEINSLTNAYVQQQKHTQMDFIAADLAKLLSFKNSSESLGKFNLTSG